MRAIITRQNPDGTYDTVGMNNRSLTKDYGSVHALVRYGIKPAVDAAGKPCKVEIFQDARLTRFFSERIWNPENKECRHSSTHQELQVKPLGDGRYYTTAKCGNCGKIRPWSN